MFVNHSIADAGKRQAVGFKSSMDLAHMTGSFAPAAPFVLVSMLGKCGDVKWVREIAATSRAHLDSE